MYLPGGHLVPKNVFAVWGLLVLIGVLWYMTRNEVGNAQTVQAPNPLLLSTGSRHRPLPRMPALAPAPAQVAVMRDVALEKELTWNQMVKTLQRKLNKLEADLRIAKAMGK